MNDIILVIEPGHVSTLIEEYVVFCNALQKRREILLVKEMSLLPTLLACGFRVLAIVAIIDKDQYLPFVTVATEFFECFPLHFSRGSITPPGFAKILRAKEVLDQL